VTPLMRQSLSTRPYLLKVLPPPLNTATLEARFQPTSLRGYTTHHIQTIAEGRCIWRKGDEFGLKRER
jgi:hypothetical protein